MVAAMREHHSVCAAREDNPKEKREFRMKDREWKEIAGRGCIAAILILVMCYAASGQGPSVATGALRGVVTDPSGAGIEGATILATNSAGEAKGATTGKDGSFEFKELAAGSYEIQAVAKGFAVWVKAGVVVAAGQTARVSVAMTIQAQQEKVMVNDTSTQVNVDPSNNANTIVLQGKDLEALSDDPDELQSELQALAGPSAGPNGGQIYIDGFTGGQLPPKASIREIRVNQNPFSSEYDKLGYGRVEVFTKPGTDKLHGQLYVSGNTAGLNARNPFENVAQGAEAPGYHSEQYSGNIGGAINKKASFFFNIERRNIEDLGIVSATVLGPGPDFTIMPFSAAIANPQTRTNLSPRIDYQLTPNNSLTARYQYFRNTEQNDNVGQFDLAETGVNDLSTEHTFQLTDTQIFGAHRINELRFQFVHDNSQTTPVNARTTVHVGGAFTGNGSGGGGATDLQNRYELQDTLFNTYGKHAMKFGGRVRVTQDESSTAANFSGQFSFDSIAQYQLFMQGGDALPTSYTQTAGTPMATVTWADAGLFAQDDWKVRPNVTASYGLRFETQNNFSNKHSFAPRLGIAWGIGGSAKNPPKTVLRGGFGIFYDRFTSSLILQEERFNGVNQVAYQVQNPTFYLSNIPPVGSLPPGTAQTIYEGNTRLHAPYTMQTGITLERQLTKSANVAVTYLNSRGVHQFYTNNLNPADPATGVRPNGDNNIYQYQSEGTFKQNQLIVNGSIRVGAKVSLFGYYTLNYSNSDTSGTGSFPSNPYELSQDYGRASFDIRNRVFVGGSISLPRGFRVSPFLIASSGIPFNITTGTDPYQDSQYNLRPVFAGSCSVATYTTKFGCFDVATPGASGTVPIPINYAEGPGRFSLNLRLSKTFGFGPVLENANAGGGSGPMGGGTFGRGPGGGGRGGPGGGGPGGFGSGTNRRYGLTLGVNARNVFNNVNLGTPVGSLTSPIFGESNSLAGRPYSDSTSNRRIDLQLTFTF